MRETAILIGRLFSYKNMQIKTYIKLILSFTQVVDPWCNYKVVFLKGTNLFFFLIIDVFSSQPLVLLLEFFQLCF